MCLLLGASGVGKTLLVKRLLTILPRRAGGQEEGGRGLVPGSGCSRGSGDRGPGAGCWAARDGVRPPPALGSLTARTAELRGWEGRPGRSSPDAAHGRPPLSRGFSRNGYPLRFAKRFGLF